MPEQVALITGGARGQGAAHAEALASAGVHVVIADVRDEEGEGTAAALGGRGLPVRYAHLDVTDERAWLATVDDIEAREGGLDVLVNNAGIIRVAPLSDLSMADWDLIQRVNATSVVLGIRAAAPAMIRRGRRLDRERRVDRRPPRRRGVRGVRGIQGGGARRHAGRGPRARTQRHPGQRDQPRWRRHADERRRAARRHVRRRSPGPARTPRRDLAARRLPRDERVVLRHGGRLAHRRRGDDPMTDTGIALVTGAGSGMGRATAEMFLERGWTTLAVDIAPVEPRGRRPARPDRRGRARPGGARRRARRARSRPRGARSTRSPTSPASTRRPRSRRRPPSSSTGCSTSTCSACSTSSPPPCLPARGLGDRELRVGRRVRRVARPARLRRVQGRRDHAHEGDGARARAAAHPRERDRAGLGRHAWQRRDRADGGRGRRRSRSAASPGRRRSPGGSGSSPAPTLRAS